jgi:hypothetical protein
MDVDTTCEATPKLLRICPVRRRRSCRNGGRCGFGRGCGCGCMCVCICVTRAHYIDLRIVIIK